MDVRGFGGGETGVIRYSTGERCNFGGFTDAGVAPRVQARWDGITDCGWTRTVYEIGLFRYVNRSDWG